MPASPFHPRCPAPRGLVEPRAVDPLGLAGPTPGQARGPAWRRTSPRLYVPSDVVRTPEQRILEQAARLPPGGAVGGWSALRLHGAAYFDGVDEGGGARPVVLVVPPHLGLRGTADSVTVRCEVGGSEIVRRHGIRCVGPERALTDEAAAARDLRAAVTVLDMGLSAGATTAQQVRVHLSTRPRMRGATQVRRALALCEDRVLSPRETWMRLLWVLDAGLPSPRCNWPVADLEGRRLGRPDLLSEELGLAGEYDGAEHRSRARHGQDVRREADFRAAGLEVVTVVATDVAHPDRVVARLRAAAERATASRGPRGWMLATRAAPVWGTSGTPASS
ncbi:hypothetical protein GCM10027596_00940 [Nocardioides korecus]